MGYADTREGWSQQKQRRDGRWRDQHGRQYHAPVEKKTGMPCGLIQALYAAPLAVPQMYIEVSQDPERPNEVFINYDRWKKDIREERKEWDRKGMTVALKRDSTFQLTAKGFPPDVLDVLGPPPQAIEPVIAASQGNRWVLGLTTKVDQRLVRFFAPDVIDPDYLVKTEPNFRDEPEGAAPMPDDDDALDETTEAHLDHEIRDAAARAQQQRLNQEARAALEEDTDPEALGGARVPVKKEASSETERKRAQRAEKRRKDEEARRAELIAENERLERDLAAKRREVEELRMVAEEDATRRQLEDQLERERTAASAATETSAPSDIDVLAASL